MYKFKQYVLKEDFDYIRDIVARHFKVKYSSYHEEPEGDPYGDHDLEAHGYGREIYIHYADNIVRIDFAEQPDQRYIPTTNKFAGAFTAKHIMSNSMSFAKALKDMVAELHSAGYPVQADAADERRRKLYDKHLNKIGYRPTGEFNIFKPALS